MSRLVCSIGRASEGETGRLTTLSDAARSRSETPIANEWPAAICNDPVRVPGMGIIGRVCGRTVRTLNHESDLNVLDAKGAIHRNIPARLAERIDEADCPVPRFKPRSPP
jgi:hypothetical protein